MVIKCSIYKTGVVWTNILSNVEFLAYCIYNCITQVGHFSSVELKIAVIVYFREQVLDPKTEI